VLTRASASRVALAAIAAVAAHAAAADARTGARAGAAPARLSVAAAANLKVAMEALRRGFEAERPGVEVAVTVGASGAFVAQIRQGAPFDLLFSADREYPRALVQAGLGGPGGEVVYAVGRLAVWLPPGARVNLERRGLAALADRAVRRIAIANPATAPYGRAALAALAAAGIEGAVKDRLVLGQNVSQAAQFAQSGAADAALVPLSLTFAPELREGRTWIVPADMHAPLEQSALVLARARDPALAEAFLRWVTGPTGREILARHGYALP
jgi:molybdate transport system substrate-binding protein